MSHSYRLYKRVACILGLTFGDLTEAREQGDDGKTHWDDLFLQKFKQPQTSGVSAMEEEVQEMCGVLTRGEPDTVQHDAWIQRSN